MTTTDPTTNLPFPPDSIQRILFTAHPIHIYSPPPLPSTRGHLAAHWTTPTAPSRQIFTARLRLLETAIASPNPATITTHILLEDPTTGALFAAAPASTCEPVLDSARFFALRVVSGARKATLGIGFEDRAVAVDFGIAMQEARKALAHAVVPGGEEEEEEGKAGAAREAEGLSGRDWSLKAGETIHVDLGRRGRARPRGDEGGGSAEADGRALFSIAPPPAYERGGLVPLSEGVGVGEGKGEGRRSRTPEGGKATATTAAELGFDDGEFGEFQ